MERYVRASTLEHYTDKDFKVYGIKGTPVPNTTMVKDNDGVWRASDEYLKAYADAFVKRIPDAQKVQVIPSLIKGRGHELTDNVSLIPLHNLGAYG